MSYCEGGGGSPRNGTASFHPGRTPNHRTTSVSLPELCAAMGMPVPPDAAFETERFPRILASAGGRLHTIGERSCAMYVVVSGAFKICALTEDGREHIVRFAGGGDVLGAEGLATPVLNTSAITMSDSVVIAIAYGQLRQLRRQYPEFQHALYTLISGEVIRAQTHMRLLGTHTAEARVARFLIELGRQQEALGHAGTTFELRMSRAEIGSYLGITLETVSRTMSAFARLRLIAFEKRRITLLAVGALESITFLPALRGPSAEKNRHKGLDQTPE